MRVLRRVGEIAFGDVTSERAPSWRKAGCRSLRRARSSSETSREEAGWFSLRCFTRRVSSSTLAMASLSWLRTFFWLRSSCCSADWMSARMSSVSMTSMSRMGSNLAHAVDDVVVVEATDHVDDRVALADVGKEVVTLAFALGGAGDEARDIDDVDRGRDDDLGAGDRLQLLHAFVGHEDHAHVGLDRAEGVVRRLGLARAREGVEEGRLAHVGESDDACLGLCHGRGNVGIRPAKVKSRVRGPASGPARRARDPVAPLRPSAAAVRGRSGRPPAGRGPEVISRIGGRIQLGVSGDDLQAFADDRARDEEQWHAGAAQRVTLDESDAGVTRRAGRERERVRLLGRLRRLGRDAACQQREQQTDWAEPAHSRCGAPGPSGGLPMKAARRGVGRQAAGEAAGRKRTRGLLGLLVLGDELVEAGAGSIELAFEHALELAHARRVTHLAERLRFDLTDTFAGDLEVAADFFERALDAVEEAEAEDEDFLLAFGEGAQDEVDLLAEEAGGGRVGGVLRGLVLDEVTERGGLRRRPPGTGARSAAGPSS